MRRLRVMDYLVALSMLVAIILSFSLLRERGANVLIVSYEDERYAFSLDKDGIYEIPGEIGITVIEIKDGRFRFLDSPCPGKTCIYSGYSDLIVCLPNKIVAKAEKEGVDAISR